MKFSILIPTYNGDSVLKETILSILSQSYGNFEIIIHDDCSKDNTIEVARSIKDKRITVFSNENNLGYPGNLEACRQKASGDILFLMGQDDILGDDAILATKKAFELNDNIGAVTRPYFWFDEDINKPVRAKEQLNPHADEIVGIGDSFEKIHAVFSTLDQLSALAYRREAVNIPFHPDIFPCHVYPFADIMKRHKVVFLKNYNLAVRIAHSQARHVSSIYDKSPMKTWIELFETVFCEDEHSELRKYLISEFVSTNYVGLVQIRNFAAKYSYLLREINELLKNRPKNLANPLFWFYSLGSAVLPPQLLVPMVDLYKIHLNSRMIKNIPFSYTLSGGGE